MHRFTLSETHQEAVTAALSRLHFSLHSEAKLKYTWGSRTIRRIRPRRLLDLAFTAVRLRRAFRNAASDSVPFHFTDRTLHGRWGSSSPKLRASRELLIEKWGGGATIASVIATLLRERFGLSEILAHPRLPLATATKRLNVTWKEHAITFQLSPKSLSGQGVA
jgi:hypothetical protein